MIELFCLLAYMLQMDEIPSVFSQKLITSQPVSFYEASLFIFKNF